MGSGLRHEKKRSIKIEAFSAIKKIYDPNADLRYGKGVSEGEQRDIWVKSILDTMNSKLDELNKKYTH